MISPIFGNTIKHNEAEKLRNEVDAFLAGGGVAKKGSKKTTPIKKMPKQYTTEYYENLRKLRLEQKVTLNDYARSASSKSKWKDLSAAIGFKVPARVLSSVNCGDIVIKNKEHWDLILKAIEELKND